MASSSPSPNLLSSFLSCKDIMPVAAMLISPSFDLHEAMMAPELCNPKMDPVLISKKIPRIDQLVADLIEGKTFTPAQVCRRILKP